MHYSALPKPIQKLLDAKYSRLRKKRFANQSHVSGMEQESFRNKFLKELGLLPG